MISSNCVRRLTQAARASNPIQTSVRRASTASSSKATPQPNEKSEPAASSKEQTKKHKKTMEELDKELQLKMKGIAGDGGESGVEYEDGQPVSMKRSVKNNMFRYI